MSFTDGPRRPAWAAVDLEEKNRRGSGSGGSERDDSVSGSEQGDYLDRAELEKDLRFRLEDRLEEGDEDVGFLGGKRVSLPGIHAQDRLGADAPTLKPPSKRRRPRALVLALVGILLLAASLGSLGASTFSAPGFTKQGGQRHMTLDHVFNGTFSARSQRIDWVKEAGDGVFSTQNREGDIFLEDAGANGTRRMLVNASEVLDVRMGYGIGLVVRD